MYILTDYTHLQQKKKDVRAKHFLYTRLTFSQSMMVTVGVSKLDHKYWTFINPWFKVNEICYCDMLLSQQLLSAIR